MRFMRTKGARTFEDSAWTGCSSWERWKTSKVELLFIRGGGKERDQAQILALPQTFPFSVTLIRYARAGEKAFSVKNYYFMYACVQNLYMCIHTYINFFSECFVNNTTLCVRKICRWVARATTAVSTADSAKAAWHSGCTRDRTFTFAAVI